ncbi:MAG: SigB/SigF/SigG family RNA polymerase sigma factor [Clostridiales bacterium]|nr:SigB/SigF/SigG family RNA polymerase sigma factor [Clostridiales bacterium]
MPLVKSIVRRFLNRGYEYDDLEQLGAIGLVKAIKNYDFNYDVRFSTYAVPLITGEIKRFLRDDGAIKISRSIKENVKKINEIRCELERKNEKEPTLSEISSISGLSVEDIILAMESQSCLVSLSAPAYEDSSSSVTVLDTVTQMSDRDEVGEISLRILLKEMLSTLDTVERQIIVLRYFKDMTQSDVAQRLSISQVQVSRMEKRILTKMREMAG